MKAYVVPGHLMCGACGTHMAADNSRGPLPDVTKPLVVYCPNGECEQFDVKAIYEFEQVELRPA